MPLRRRFERQLARELDQKERNAKTAAAEAVSHVTACFVSDADEYEARAAIVFCHPKDNDNLVVFQLFWDDDDRTDYFLSGNVGLVVRGWSTAADEADAERLSQEWVGDSCHEVEFNFLPGLYQHVFVEAVTGLAPPAHGLGFLWVVPIDSELWLVRPFPSGIGEGEKVPPIGEVRYLMMDRGAIDEFWRLRGW